MMVFELEYEIFLFHAVVFGTAELPYTLTKSQEVDFFTGPNRNREIFSMTPCNKVYISVVFPKQFPLEKQLSP